MYNQIDSNKRKTNILMLLFLSFIILLGWFFGDVLQYGYGIFAFSIVISLSMTWFSFYHGDKVALSSTGAKEIKQSDNPYVYRMVQNLAITAGIPMPKVHIIDSPALNAFATGRDPEHASVAVTTGIIDALENEELEGVIAHELSHIKNYDIRVMTIVIVLVGTVSLLGDLFLRMQFAKGRENDSKGSAAGILMIVGIVFIILSPFVAEIIKLAISRKREYLADASGALLTRYPEGLARALEKISMSKVPLKAANSATAHLFISNPLKGKTFSKLFSTHPPIEDRIKELRNM